MLQNCGFCTGLREMINKKIVGLRSFSSEHVKPSFATSKPNALSPIPFFLVSASAFQAKTPKQAPVEAPRLEPKLPGTPLKF